MSEEQNKSIVYHWVDEAWNSGNFSSAKALYPASYQLHDDSLPAPVTGPEGLIGFISTFRRGLPDIHLSIEQMTAEGEVVTWRFWVTGSYTAELLGIPATNQRVSLSGMVMSRFAQGQWVEDYANWDVFTMLRQLGVIPEMAPKG